MACPGIQFQRLLSVALLPFTLAAQNVITTIAGVDPVFTGDGQPAVNVPIGYVNGVTTDSTGNVYFSDPLEHLILRVSTDGTLSVVAGNGIAGYSGDGGPATMAAIGASDNPNQYVGVAFEDGLGGIAVDKQGNVYFADGHRIRRVAGDGTISTIAGGGTHSPGDGAPATQALLGIVNGLVFDGAGSLFFAEGNRIRKLSLDGTLTTFAGTGINGFSGDNGPATVAQLSQPQGLAFDGQGTLYISDGDVTNFASRIRKITSNGAITTVAGGGTRSPADGVSPLNLDLTYATGVAVDSTGAIYVFAPYGGFLIKLAGGTTTLVTSRTTATFATNVTARSAYVAGLRQYDNSGIAFDPSGNLYVADSRDGHLCKIDTRGIFTNVAGNGQYGMGGDGGPALSALIQGPTALTQTPDGTIYFLDTLNIRVRAISPAGVISSVITPDNVPALGNKETLNGIASDSSGNLYVALEHRILLLAPNGTTRILVNLVNKLVDGGDGGPATQATLQSTGGLARDAAGNLYVSDPVSNRIRVVTPDGLIHTVAGTGIQGISPDGSVAAMSQVSYPTSLFADSSGGLYFEESPPPPANLGTATIRYITPDGHLKTIVGNGNGDTAFSGDGGPAVQAGVAILTTGMALDKFGNFYFSDSFHNRVRMVAPNGIISTVVGNGVAASSGDGGLAKNASLIIPSGLLFDASGNLWISERAGDRIREVLAAPPPVSISPAQMTFSGKSGGAQTPPQKLSIESPVSGLNFSITKSSGADWLVLGGTAGNAPRLINVRADPSNLAPGTYQATLTVAARFGNVVSANVNVSFQVAQGDNPKLAVDHSSLSFTFPRNPTTSLSQNVRVLNAGTGTLAYSARVQTATGGTWLSISPTGGNVTPQSPAMISVTANPNGLSAGTYTGTITFTSSTSGETAALQVNLTVSALDQAVQLSHKALSFIAVANGGVVPPSSFAVKNIGRGTANFTVSTQTLAGGQWLSATPKSGAATAGIAGPSVTVSVNQAGLAPGFYYGLVRIDSPGAANTPQIATIALHVLAADQDPGPVVQPNELVFTAVQGAPPPGSKNVFVYNVSATPQTYTSSVTTPDPNDQLGFDPQDSTLKLTAATRIVVQPLTDGLAPGVYDADLTLQFSDGFVRRVGVRTIITPAHAMQPTGSARATLDSSACTPTQLVPAITSLGQSFGVPAAWPVPLEAEVRDDCGTTLDTGNVSVSFSNGDPALSLRSEQGGLWQSTWVAGHSSGPVTVTVTAIDPGRNLTGTRDVTGGLGDDSQAPTLAAAVNAASFAANTPLAPGAIISLFGLDLANGTASAGPLPLGTTLAGATVLMAGTPLPLIYAANGQVPQINAVVPAGIVTNTNHQIILQRGNTLSAPFSVDVGPAEPGIFPYPAPGDPPTQGAIVNALTYVVAHPGTPVGAGDIIAIFCTGLGAVDKTVPDGAAAPGSPAANTVATATVTIGGKPAQVTFAGLSPGFAGLYQIDAIVPSGVTAGNQVPVVVSIAGQTGPAATIAVK